MKTLLRFTFGAVLLAPTAVLAGPPAPVQAPVQAPAKVAQAPAQAPVQAPAKTAQANTGYRTYSYQPGTAPMYNGYATRANRAPRYGSGFNPASYKVTGQW